MTLDLVVQRHGQRGGLGPALISLSSFEPMGRQRLLRAFQAQAGQRAGQCVLAYGAADQAELGEYMDAQSAVEAAPGMG